MPNFKVGDKVKLSYQKEAKGLVDINEFDNLNILKENNVLDETRLQEVENHIKLTTSMEEAVRGACFIQESAPEHYDVKHQVVKEIEKYCLDDAIIASSTSGLLISEIAKNMFNKLKTFIHLSIKNLLFFKKKLLDLFVIDYKWLYIEKFVI